MGDSNADLGRVLMTLETIPRKTNSVQAETQTDQTVEIREADRAARWKLPQPRFRSLAEFGVRLLMSGYLRRRLPALWAKRNNPNTSPTWPATSGPPACVARPVCVRAPVVACVIRNCARRVLRPACFNPPDRDPS